MNEDKLKEFTLLFFKNLNCHIKEEEDIFSIEGIPPAFEKFCGKSGPYIITFNPNKQSKAELINFGNYLLKAIKDYLEGRGETTLIKLVFDIDPKKIIEENFPLMNSKMFSFSLKENFQFFSRFSFMTVLQYLNKKEQIIKNIFVEKGKIIDFELDDYSYNEGIKREVKIDGVDKDYVIAKEFLQKELKPIISKVADNLEIELEKETQRVKNHFESKLSEFLSRLESYKKKRDSLIEEIKNSKGDEKSELDRKLKVLERNIENLENNEDFLGIKKEEESILKQENNRHSINVKTKLINTTLIYYPIFSINFYVKNSLSRKDISIEYNPLLKKIIPPKCDACKKEVQELILCSSGHLTCRNCGERCQSCNEIYCKLCLKEICSQSKKKICSKCSSKCSVCGKIKTKIYMNNMPDTGRVICKECTKYCGKCGKMVDPNNLKKDSRGRIMCLKCHSSEFARENLGFLRGG